MQVNRKMHNVCGDSSEKNTKIWNKIALILMTVLWQFRFWVKLSVIGILSSLVDDCEAIAAFNSWGFRQTKGIQPVSSYFQAIFCCDGHIPLLFPVANAMCSSSLQVWGSRDDLDINAEEKKGIEEKLSRVIHKVYDDKILNYGRLIWFVPLFNFAEMYIKPLHLVCVKIQF